ncbi:hypothetical protein [Clostridium ljungdahlii]|uniref:Uncharacterized protein n=1 Tax=Clostridium ljungdahlii TaxID=1538 RepID=A0A162NA61_9CLOT|nr:hypothetical protein [Clostridium ljungdahlii]OAA90889.1 hypothetical protein WY13_00955 [Clostridium ljungdahlii]
MINKIDEMVLKLKGEEMSKIEREWLFTDLYVAVQPEFSKIIRRYFTKKNLLGFTFDVTDYESRFAQIIQDAITDFDKNKGTFMALLCAYADIQFKDITRYNLAQKRFDMKQRACSFDELFEGNGVDIEDLGQANLLECDTALSIIKEFIKTDKEGQIISILASCGNKNDRKEMLKDYFNGKYGATERKKVQRVRERLAKNLLSSGIFL